MNEQEPTEVISIYALQVGDVIPSHDGKTHTVASIREHKSSGKEWARIVIDRGPEDVYSIDRDLDDTIRVVQ